MTKRRETSTCRNCEKTYPCSGRSQPYCSLDCAVRSRVDMRGADDCWAWQGAANDHGYGQIRWRGSLHYAHRLAYELANGPLGDSHLLHRCDNPPCCNPGHLIPGTARDNMADMHRKGRWPAERVARGEATGGAKLTAASVLEIRKLYAAGGCSQYELARTFGVGQPAIGHIITRRTWKHVA